jgi:hypothetical protein
MFVLTRRIRNFTTMTRFGVIPVNAGSARAPALMASSLASGETPRNFPFTWTGFDLIGLCCDRIKSGQPV